MIPIPEGWRLLEPHETIIRGDRHEAWGKYWFPVEIMISEEVSNPIRIIRYNKTNTQT